MEIKERKEKLKFLGFYSGKIDNSKNASYNEAIKKIQNKYFFNLKDKDGIAGKNTDILINSVYNVKKYTKNFDVLKDKMYCQCKGKYCTGYPVTINKNLLINLQKERDYSGITTITSLLRCVTWNKKQGGINNSKHTKGKAVDFRNKNTQTLALRKNTVNRWIKNPSSNYSYCNGYYKTKFQSGTISKSSMGVSVHGDVI